MTDKERIERLEDRLLELRYRVDALDKSVLVEVEPQHPNPGTVVAWRSCVDHPWSFGIVAYESWVVTLQGGYRLDDPSIEYRPVYIVTPPPSTTFTWQGRVWDVYEHRAGLMAQVPADLAPVGWGKHVARVTQEQVERREAGDA